MKPHWAALLVGAALALSWQAQAQIGTGGSATGATASDQSSDAVTIVGQKMPKAEAPLSATCEALANDPHVRAQIAAGGNHPLMGPTFYLPTRLPRNPDYTAPPLTPIGSPLPLLPKTRFGVSAPVLSETNAAESFEETVGQRLLAGVAEEPAPGQLTLEQSVEACRHLYARGGGRLSYPGADVDRDNLGNGPLMSLESRYLQARASIVRHDKTLPMAFALFDQRRFAESLDWFRKAHRKLQFREGGNEAALFIGKLYLEGLGENSDPREAIKWLKKAATAPFNPTSEMPVFDPKEPARNTAIGEAAVILGNVYRLGFKDVPRDLEKARKWYERAFEVGHVPAAKVLGDFYYEGIGTTRDVKKAISYYRKAARLDYAPAQFALADLLYFGDEGIERDLEKALLWYRAAARYDHAGALYALARAYDTGEGVEADPQLAAGFYKSAALRGNSAARAAMGSYFYEGNLLPRDHTLARQWFEAAAAGSDPLGMFNLGAMMARGEGGSKDLVKAWVWMKRATALGNAPAASAIATLEREMTAAQKAAAVSVLAQN